MELDLVDEMAWENSDKIEFVSLESAGLEMVDADADTIPFVQRIYFNEEM